VDAATGAISGDAATIAGFQSGILLNSLKNSEFF